MSIFFRKFKILILLFSFLANPAFSQYNPEINALIKNVREASYQDSARLFKTAEESKSKIANSEFPQANAEILIFYGNYFFYVRKMETARSYYEKALTEAEKFKSDHLIQLAKIRLAFYEFEQGNPAQAEEELLQLLAGAKKTKDNLNTAELLNLLGIVKEDKNEMKEVAKLYIEGTDLSETNHLDYYSGVFRNNLGLLRYATGQNDKAQEDFEKGLQTAIKINDQRLASHIRLNLCMLFIAKNKFDEARSNFNEALSYSRKNNLPIEVSVSYLTLGSAFFRAGKNELALSYYDSAIFILKKFRLEKELTRAYGGKAEILFQMGKIKEASEIIELEKTLALKTGNLEDLSSYYYFQYRKNQNESKFKDALENYLSYSRLEDSMRRNLNSKIINELQGKYNLQKKQIELEKERSKSLELEKKNRDAVLFKWIAIIGALGLLIVISVLFYFRYTKKIREKQEAFSRLLIEKIEEERKRISMDLHDDIGQSLSVIKSKISKTNGVNSELEIALGQVIEQTRQISRDLFPAYLEKIGLVRAVATLAESIQNVAGIECSYEITDEVEKLSLVFKTNIFRIIQECVNNTIKHAEASALKIQIEKRGEEFKLLFQDSGKGMKDVKTSSGLGLLSMQERVKMMKGSFTLDKKNSDKGVKIIIKFTASAQP
ncbi:MAG: hypothetical protein IAF38_02580 [Bacteroidia bacterium]|nr:hypothetical protein [Bacteroidia bacterium]